jgi:hypothetical protein
VTEISLSTANFASHQNSGKVSRLSRIPLFFQTLTSGFRSEFRPRRSEEVRIISTKKFPSSELLNFIYQPRATH